MDEEKPFACTFDGCNMTFTNEDHLNVHKSKHNVGLSIEDDKNGFVADQTPTPTRFIRNCEEVGLFQDLQNVNPFDETFKKAAELAKNGILHVPESTADDTLHTPHILLHVAEQKVESSKNNQEKCGFTISRISSLEEDLLKISNTDNNDTNEGAISDDDDLEIVSVTSTQEGSRNNQEDAFSLTNNVENGNRVFSTSRVPSIDENLLRIDESPVPNNDSIKNKGVENRSKKFNSNENLKSRIRQALQKSQAERNCNQGLLITPIPIEKLRNVDSATVVINQKPDPTIVRPPRKRAAKTQSNNTTKRKPGQTDENLIESDAHLSIDAIEKREVNRHAQMRSRERKKRWIKDMLEKIDALTTKNSDLIIENEELKNENCSLRNILLFHRDCNVTKDPVAGEKIRTMLKNQKVNVVEKSKTIPIKPLPSTSQILPAQMPKLLPKPSNNVQICVLPTPLPSIIPATTPGAQLQQFPISNIKNCIITQIPVNTVCSEAISKSLEASGFANSKHKKNISKTKT